MFRKGLSLAATLALLGCGNRAVPPAYAVVYNGGLGPESAACDGPGYALRGDTVAVWRQNPEGCTEGQARAPADTAAYAYWQTTSSARPVGPAPSNRVTLRLLPLLATGGDAQAPHQGDSQARLAFGSDEKQVRSGASSRELARARATRRLDQAPDQRELATGRRQRALADGAGARALQNGSSARRVLELTKAVDPGAVYEGNDGRFVITVRNVGKDVIVRLVLLDRVDARLRVTSLGGGFGRRVALPDGSTLAVWDDRQPLAPGASRPYPINFQVPPRSR